MSVESLWDEVLGSTLRGANTTQSARKSACRPLALRPVQAEWLTHKVRQIERIDPQLRTILRQLVRGEAPWPLFLHGAAGVGKTCAALCLLDTAGGIYVTAEELCEKLIQADNGALVNPWTKRPMTKVGFWESIYSTKLMVLDELGTRQRPSDFHCDNVKRVLDQRENRPLVAISNPNLERLADVYDDRIASRLCAGTVLELCGADRRLAGDGSKGIA